jgi:hypothetical protein
LSLGATSIRRDDLEAVQSYFSCRGCRREAARACSKGRRASRMSRNSPSVVSSLSGFDCFGDVCCEERLLRPLTYRKASRTPATSMAMKAGITGDKKGLAARL